MTKLQFLDNPALEALRTAFQIRDGRLHVEPFAVNLGATTMNVSGSNGLDQSLQYALRAAGAALRAGRRGEPGGRRAGVAGGRSRDRSQGGARDRARHPARRHGDEPLGQGRRGQRRLVGEGRRASRRCARRPPKRCRPRRRSWCRRRSSGPRRSARRPRRWRRGEEGGLPAGGRADGPGDQSDPPCAAKPAADQLRKEADSKAAGIIREADQRADSLVAEARRQADKTAGEK